MNWLAVTFAAVAVIAGLVTIVLILLSPRDASGLGDMFGGVGDTLTSSASAKGNLDKMTVISGLIWFTFAVAAGLVTVS